MYFLYREPIPLEHVVFLDVIQDKEDKRVLIKHFKHSTHLLSCNSIHEKLSMLKTLEINRNRFVKLYKLKENEFINSGNIDLNFDQSISLVKTSTSKKKNSIFDSGQLVALKEEPSLANVSGSSSNEKLMSSQSDIKAISAVSKKMAGFLKKFTSMGGLNSKSG